MKKTNLKVFMSKNSYWTINKKLAREIGLIETLVLQHIIDLQSVFERTEIFQPINEMSDELGLSEYAVKLAIGKLKSLGLIEVQRKSVGYKNFYKVNEDSVLELANGAEQLTSESNTAHQLVEGVSELDSNDEWVENLPTSESNTALSESKTTALKVENLRTITKNTTNNELQKIDTKNTTTGVDTDSTKNIIQKSILDILTDYDSDIKKYNSAIEEYNELGAIDGISEIMEWDDSVKSKWFQKIQNVYAIR
jgi:biotin operon repressor